MKRAGEFVLVDRRRAIHPEQELNIKAGMLVDDDLRLAKSRLRLRRLGIIQQEAAKKLLQIHMRSRSVLLQLLHGDTGKCLQREIPLPPARQD